MFSAGDVWVRLRGVDISEATTRKALQELADDGFIVEHEIETEHVNAVTPRRVIRTGGSLHVRKLFYTLPGYPTER